MSIEVVDIQAERLSLRLDAISSTMNAMIDYALKSEAVTSAESKLQEARFEKLDGGHKAIIEILKAQHEILVRLTNVLSRMEHR